MKKHLLSLFAVAAMLFATSCSEEELTYENGNKQNVTFKVAVEGAGTSSRTIENPDDPTEKIYIGQGEMVDKLFYAVYESKGTDCLLEGEATVANGVATVVIPLVNGLEYDLVFLAYNKANNAFGIPSALTFDNGRCNAVDLENLTLKSGLFANTEAYDAFYHVKSNYVTNTSSTTPVVLHRMFAQLNVATTNEDLTNATQLNVNVTKTALELKNVPNQFNARTGEIGQTRTNVVFGKSEILKCADTQKHEILAVNKNGEDEYFNYLAMAYVLADKGKSLHDVNISFYRDSENESFHTRTIPSVPLQRQYRTNITGNILTQQEAFSISLDTTFVNREYNESVGDVVIIPSGDSQALQAAIENAQPNVPVEIQINGHIVLGENNNSSTFSRAENEPTAALKIEAGREITIDLNGFTISHEKACDGSYSMIENNGKLTILDSSEERNGKISFKDTGAGDSSFGWGTYTINNRGELVVEDGTIEHLGGQAFATHMICAIFQYSGSTTINGGTISTPNYRSARLWKGDMTINAGTFEGQLWVQAVDNSAALTINGGSFSPKGNDASSVFVENKTYDVTFSVTGGTFNTKIGCSDATKLAGPITGGTFTEDAKNNTLEALLGNKYGFVQNENGTYDVKRGDYLTLDEFVQAVNEAEGNYDGQGTLVKIMVKGGDARTETIEGLPNRLQMYGNPNVYYAQYQRFAELTDVNISNVNFEFVPAEVTVTDAWNTNGATATVDQINGELQFMNAGKVTLTNCTFDKVSVSPINAASLEVVGCTFKDLKAYAIKDIKASSVINNNTFTNCNGGFWFADAPQSITANNNIFTGVGRRGAIQFSAAGDYTNSSIEIKGNNVEGHFLWQLNNTVTDEQLKGIFEDNTYTEKYVTGSIQPVAMIGGVEYRTLELAVAAAQASDEIKLIGDVTLTEALTLPAGITFNGNGKQINGSISAGGDLTFVGHTKVTAFSASYYNRTITIGEGACLEVTGTGRVTLGYGNTFNITGSIEKAKDTDKANVEPSLIIPGGISITGGNNAAMNVTNAYVQIGSTTSKPGAANGEFTLNFTNSIVEFTNEFGFYAPTGGVNPQFKMSITNSVFTTGAKLCVAAVNSTITVNNSNVLLGTYLRNSGTLNIIEGSVLTGKTIQFGENGGNDGTINVDASTLEIVAGSTGHAFDGKENGSINATNCATVKVDYYKAMTINTDATSTFEGIEVK